MRIENDIKLDFKDVLIRPKRSTLSSRSQVNLERRYVFKNEREFKGIPIIAANMQGVGTFSMLNALKLHDISTALDKNIDFVSLMKRVRIIKRDGQGHIGFTIPETELNEILSYGFLTFGIDEHIFEIDPEEYPDFNLDVANGYQENFLDYVERVREYFPKSIIMAGNVCTPEMTEALLLAGADIVKVGIGPGSVCTTRKVTGVGYPQLSAIIECADAAHGLKGYICADGGCTSSGDIAKAFGAGADFVMLGGMLAGHDEGEGKIIDCSYHNTEKYVEFYGSSSKEAQPNKSEYSASEGKKVRIPYRGSVENTIKEILGGLRSACTYVGAESLKELSKRTTFVRVSQQLNNVFGNE